MSNPYPFDNSHLPQYLKNSQHMLHDKGFTGSKEQIKQLDESIENMHRSFANTRARIEERNAEAQRDAENSLYSRGYSEGCQAANADWRAFSESMERQVAAHREHVESLKELLAVLEGELLTARRDEFNATVMMATFRNALEIAFPDPDEQATLAWIVLQAYGKHTSAVAQSDQPKEFNLQHLPHRDGRFRRKNSTTFGFFYKCMKLVEDWREGKTRGKVDGVFRKFSEPHPAPRNFF